LREKRDAGGDKPVRKTKTDSVTVIKDSIDE
jgi:hypothetical protein